MRSILIALTTYTSLPLPEAQWSDRDLACVLCWLPLAGVLCGAVLFGWLWLADCLHLGALLTAAVGTVLPLLVSGGIHLDGFCDTMDALSSHQSAEKMRDILHDPRAGAFAVISCGCFLLLMAGCLSELAAAGNGAWLSVALGGVLARAEAAFFSARLPRYSDSGMLAAFILPMNKGAVTAASAVFALLVLAALLLISPLLALMTAAAQGLLGLYFCRLVRRRFHGLSGDLAGWLTETSELLTAAVTVAAVLLQLV